MRNASTLLAALAIAVAAVGCVPTTSQQGVGGYCHRDPDCLDGLRCVERVCRANGGSGDRDAGPTLDAGASVDAGVARVDAGRDAGEAVDAGRDAGGRSDSGATDSGATDAGATDAGD